MAQQPSASMVLGEVLVARSLMASTALPRSELVAARAALTASVLA
jgi:hypothetical protein